MPIIEKNCLTSSVVTRCLFNHTDGQGYPGIDGESTTDFSNDTKNINVTVDNLSAFSIYDCSARSINDAGTSNWSSPIRIMTEEDVPSLPQNFRIASMDNSTRLKLAWDKPKYIPGIFKGYSISLVWYPRYPTPDVCNKSDRKIIIDDIATNVNQYTFGDLKESLYLAKIAAKTGAGFGREDSIIYYTPDSGGRYIF